MLNKWVGESTQRRKILHVTLKILQSSVLELPLYCLSLFKSNLLNPAKSYKIHDLNFNSFDAGDKILASVIKSDFFRLLLIVSDKMQNSTKRSCILN